MDIKEYEHLEIHETIEELMVVANSIVAQRLFHSFPSCSLLRIHQSPQTKQLEVIHAICEYLKIPCYTRNNLELAKTIQFIYQHCDETQRALLMQLLRK